MSQSFFQLAPDNDHSKPLGSLSSCDPDDCASYTEEEYEAIMEHAMALSEALEETIDAYAKAHPELTYEMVMHALDCMAYCVKAYINEASADA